MLREDLVPIENTTPWLVLGLIVNLHVVVFIILLLRTERP